MPTVTLDNLDNAAARIWAKRRARSRTLNIRAARRFKSARQFLDLAFG